MQQIGQYFEKSTFYIAMDCYYREMQRDADFFDFSGRDRDHNCDCYYCYFHPLQLMGLGRSRPETNSLDRP